MDDARLIQSVQEFVEIYDSSHPKYCDGPHRTRLWTHIAQQLRQEPSKCKARWESLRSQFRKQLRNSRAKGKDTSLVRWRFAGNLQFLLPYMKEKAKYLQYAKPPPPISVVKENFPDYSAEGLDAEVVDGGEGYSHGTWTSTETDRMTPEPSQSVSLGDNGTHASIRRPIVKSELMQQHPSEPTSSGFQMMKHFLDTADQHSPHHEETAEEMDEIDYFFASMKASVKKFSDADKVIAKREIFHVINDIEMRMFQENPLMD